MEISLNKCLPNKKYLISKIMCIDSIKLRLNELGVQENKIVEIKNYNYGKGAMIIKVMGVRIAIEKNIYEKIFVINE